MHKNLQHLRSRYGITKEQYIEMYRSQDGICEGCGTVPSGGGRSGANSSLFVDHNHSNGDIRGLLCQGCNAAIGLAKDSPAVLRKLAEYLEAPPVYKGEELLEFDKGRRMRERTHCKNGHEYTQENTRWRKMTNRDNPGRVCRTCEKVWESKRKGRRNIWSSATGNARVTEID